MSFQQGLSGLSASAKTLDVIGNNVANVGTVGYKSASAEFSDVFANSMSGSGTTPVGIGVRIDSVSTSYTQGNFTTTNNPLDVGITGSGFFILKQNGLQTYSRNGQFKLDKSGQVVNASGGVVQGYMPDASGKIDSSKLKNLTLSTSELPPRVTSSVTAQVNCDATKTALNPAGFNATDPNTYHSSTSATVYDSLGNSHTLSLYYVKSAANTWSTFATMDGTQVTGGQANGAVGIMNFNADGTLNAGTSTIPMAIPAGMTNGAAALAINLNPTGTTQFGSNFSINNVNQDGYSPARMADFSITASGMIRGRYTNGMTYDMGQVAMADFRDTQGLQPIGNNSWVETGVSGTATISTPGSSGLGTLQSGAVEDSNVDLTAELVNMITAQRMYQANANSIKTQDQVLQTLVNLKQ